MSDEGHIESVIREADAWLECHKVTETWRTMNRLRDTLVRLAGQSQGAKSAAFDEGWKARAERDPLVMNIRGHSAPPPPAGLNPYRKGN